MRESRKITYAAAAAAIAVVCMVMSSFLPLKFTPLMVCGLCFFIALRCGLPHGLLSIAATLLISFFAFGGVTMTFLSAAFIFAPYSLIALFLKKTDYKKLRGVLIRAGAVTALIFSMLSLIVFGFGDAVTEFTLGLSLNKMLELLGGRALGYVILSLIGSALMIGYDYLFLMAWAVLNKRLKIKHDAHGRTDNYAGGAIDNNGNGEDKPDDSNNGNSGDIFR